MLVHANRMMQILDDQKKLVGAYNPNSQDYINMYVYRSDNYELIQTIEEAHIRYVSGFLEINSHLIYSYSYDKNIKQWIF